jgi:hypothetical protein
MKRRDRVKKSDFLPQQQQQQQQQHKNHPPYFGVVIPQVKLYLVKLNILLKHMILWSKTSLR